MADARDAARHPGRRPRHMILAIETSCDDTCAAVVTRAGEIRSNVVSSQGVHARFGGVVPEWASRHHLELVNPVVDQALEGTSLRRDRADRGHAGPRAGRRAAGRRGHGEGPGGVAAAAAGGGQPPAGARRGELPRRLRAAVPVPGRLRRAHVPRAGDRPRRATRRSARRSTTPRARRSTRAPGCSASATRADRRCRSWPRPVTRRRSSSRSPRRWPATTSRSRA